MKKKPIDHLGIPPLGGVCTYEEAFIAGYDVDINVNLLKRYNYIETRIHEAIAAHLAHTPEWEVKSALGLHLWLESEHSALIRKRISEMRQPPLHLDAVPDPSLKSFFDELIRSLNTIELLVGLYRIVKTDLAVAYKKHLSETNPLADHPTYRILSWIVQEEEQMTNWGNQALNALLTTTEEVERAKQWEDHLRFFLQKAGGITGNVEVLKIVDVPPPIPGYDGKPYDMDANPRRDERFKDVYNRTAKFVEYFKDESKEMDERTFALFYKRLKEMDVPEWMAPIIFKTKGKPWEYYVDLSRQLWDETRHALMGQVALYKEGMAFYKYPVDMAASAVLNSDFDPLDAHLVLWGIEQGLMTKDGKQLEWRIAKSSGNRLAMLFQDYDWADEVLHSQFGRKWLLPEYKDLEHMKESYKMLNVRFQESREHLSLKKETKEWWPQFVEEMRELKKLNLK